MTPTRRDVINLQAPRRIDRDALKYLAGRPGPFITLIVPDHHPPAAEGSRQSVIESLTKEAAERLKQTSLAAQASELLAPLKEIAREESLAHGGPGLAIFRSANVAAWYIAPGHPARLVIASHPYLAPFIEDAFAPNDIFVLGLSIKKLRLFRCVDGECTELSLPAGIPVSFLETEFNLPDLEVENRTAVGPSSGKMGSMRFGTAAEREAMDKHLHTYFVTVDRGLKPVVGDKPLLLIGVHEEIEAFKRAAKYAQVFSAVVEGNPSYLSPAQIAARTREAARAEYYRRGAAVLAEYREMEDRTRAISDIRAVLRAAMDGRIHRLCVRKNAQYTGYLQRGANPANIPDQDLVNAAVAETLRTGGEVFELPQDQMAAEEPVAAILRY